ncbi:urocanate hydratase [Actinocorallia populi]|uniref:urocanate hydratase n=1 Tax=Actinocorallia populi TaxID=2079200 RepID=UPI000D08C79D|nr:urocanate hydratase [Actinocorallia populi]
MKHFPVRAARGTALSARGWPQEAALRMLANSLDPEVAEHPESLTVCGGGKAARGPGAYAALVRCLTELGEDETLLVQSGKPVGVLRTHEWAPRVLLANSNLVPEWATREEFRQLEELGLIMAGQTAAGSWIHVGAQGVLQAAYETFAAVAARRFGGTLAGTVTLTAGLGGMGGAQPLAVTMNGGAVICVECDPARVAQRVAQGYCDVRAESAEEALALALRARDSQRPLSVALPGNAAETAVRLLAAGAPLDIVTDQTPAHDPLRYLPIGVPFEELAALREDDPGGLALRALESMARHAEAMVGFQAAGAEVFDYGNSLRDQARLAGYEHAFAYPGFVPAYLRPLFCAGKGPFRWVALSGDAHDIGVTDRAVLELFPHEEPLARWIRAAREKVPFQGLPARVCWLGQGERAAAGLRFNELVARGDLGAPLVIGRDHLDCGSVAAPHSETEGMLDGSDAIADWPLLNALLATASGATWVSLHQGAGAGVGRSVHAGQVAVADGTPQAARRLERVLTNDPGIGVLRHADAGYARAVETAGEHGFEIPMEPPEPGGAREAGE